MASTPQPARRYQQGHAWMLDGRFKLEIQTKGEELVADAVARDHTVMINDLRVALQSISDMVGDAVDKKIRTGRMPPIGELLSCIEDTADSALSDAREAAARAEGGEA